MPKHTNASDPQPVSEDTVKTLIDKLERDELSSEDKKLIAKALGSYLFAARLLKESGVKIKNLRDFFGFNKEKPVKPVVVETSVPPPAGPSTLDTPLLTPPDPTPRTTPTKLRLVSHGRLSANDYTGAEQRHCPHPKLKAVCVSESLTVCRSLP